MSKLQRKRFAGRVSATISVLGVSTAHAAAVPPAVVAAGMELPLEFSLLLVAPLLLLTFGCVVWMLLSLGTKPEKKNQSAATAGMVPPEARPYPYLPRTGNPAAGSVMWYDGALDCGRFRKTA